MLIKVINRFTQSGLEYYEWDLHSGPDGIDHVHGYATDLISAFTKILEWEERIGADYATEILTDNQNAQQFLTSEPTDETD